MCFALIVVPTDQEMPSRVRDDAEPLFSRYDSHALQEARRREMSTAITEADPELIRSGDAAELAKRYADDFSLKAPHLIEGATSMDAEEAKVDVTGDIRFGAFGPEPTYAFGIRVCYYVPYSGDSKLFHCAASTRSLSMRPINLGAHELKFVYERPGQDVAATEVEFQSELAQLKEVLGWLTSDFDAFNSSLAPQAKEKIVGRKARIEQMYQGVESLGVPIKRTAIAQGGRPAPVRPEDAKATRVERYDVALSFAGENRPYVEEVAERLKSSGVSVFYDKFETANLWGRNLIEHFADIYGQRSGFVVMFVSKHYVEKAWTSHERRHAQDRQLLARSEYILPARFDDTDVPGMPSTVGYVDLRHTDPANLVSLILQKLGRGGTKASRR